MTERTYTLGDITGVLGDALKAVGDPNAITSRRALDLLIQETIDRLKALPAPDRSKAWSWGDVLHGDEG